MLSLVPRDTGFYNLFDESAAILTATASAYVDMLNAGMDRDEHMQRIRAYEHANDGVVRRTLEKLDRAFFTPFDREDIYRLTKRMDDVVDDIDAAAKRLRLYKITRATPWLIRQSELLVTQSQCLCEAIGKLRNHKKQPGAMHDSLVKVHHAESVGDDNHHAAVVELYETAPDAIHALKWKEIYDLTERAIDRCEDVADVLEGILLKNA